MNGRAIRAVVITVTVLVVAAIFWPSWQSREDVVDPLPFEQTNVAVPPAAAPREAERRDWFPVPSESGPALSTADPGTRPSRRFDCSLEDFQRGLDEEEREARNGLLAETLSRSANAEDQLAAAMVRGAAENGPRVDNLRMALAADPMHPLVLWQVADDCRRGRGGEYCQDSYVRTNLETVLGGNGWYWVQVAAFYHEQGMFAESLEATQRAVTAPEFNDYFIDYVLLLERAFGADSDRDYLDRVVAAMGYTAALPSDFLARQCTERAESDVAWLDSCTMLAERYEQDGTNLLMHMVGLGMQENLYAQSGLAGEVRDAANRMAELRGLLDRVDADYQLVQALDPQINARYLDVWKSSGELAAFEYGLDAAEQLLEDPEYDPCIYAPSE